ncbi:ATP-dependent DNA helicase RecG [Patescibacteria group bacterium]
MMKLKLKDKISVLPKVGPKTEESFSKLGIKTVSDLLWHLPVSYQDLSKITKIRELQPNALVTIKATLQAIANKRAWKKRMAITEALVEDGTGSMQIVWFNQPYLEKSLKTGREYFFTGKVQFGQRGLQLVSPAWELVKREQTHAARIVPVYPLSGRLSSKLVRFLMKQVLPLTDNIKDWLPSDIRERQKLSELGPALEQIHFPENIKKQKAAKRRLAFDELFLIQLAALFKRQELQSYKAVKIPFDKTLIQDFVGDLGFTLTNAQRKSSWEILQDMEKPTPMNRLLEGDVGSGKTLVAAIALLEVAKARKQAVIMAPTEVLAHQHFLTLSHDFAKHDVKLGLLTNSYKIMAKKGKDRELRSLRPVIKRGDIDIIIGTHALIQAGVEYNDLALVVIDEQHRFGVNQRKALKDKTPSKIPHFLSMTATPIPRTLTLTLYGDLDISLIDEMPRNRKPIKTFYVPPQKRQRTYDFIRKEINAGRQVFVITPLIEESDKLGVKSATQEYEKLSTEVFPDLKIGLLHGQLKPKEKEGAMKQFKDKTTDILVATAVVEVGVDIPNATIMMIEGAERFGLAQLHQFRGRVGRGQHQSYCFLFTDSNSDSTKRRLEALIKSRNGFDLAEKDLEQRGPGEVFGTRQAGIPDLRVASLTDLPLIKDARQEATKLLATGIDKHSRIAKKTAKFRQEIHWE